MGLKITLAVVLLFGFATTCSAASIADQPIPDLSILSTSDYHGLSLNLRDKRRNERLVKIQEQSIAGESYYRREDGLNPPYYRSFRSAEKDIQLRKTVVEKLKAVNHRLEKYGVEVFVLDGFRPVETQKELWNYFCKKAAAEMPGATLEAQKAQAARYCSNAENYSKKDSKTWPTHCTGGAVDLTLRRKGGDCLFMGGIFDDDSEVSHTSYFERHDKTVSDQEARRNRRLLYWAMEASGFANYHYEWWHYDFGNQMWAMNKVESGGKEKGQAFYGPAR